MMDHNNPLIHFNISMKSYYMYNEMLSEMKR